MIKALRMFSFFLCLAFFGQLGQSQLLPVAHEDTLVLGNELVSPSIEQVERDFFSNLDQHTECLIQLHDSLKLVLELPIDHPQAPLIIERSELETSLQMYKEMIKTNQRLLQGQMRIKDFL